MLSPEFEAATPVLAENSAGSDSAPATTVSAAMLTPRIPCARRRAARHAEIDRDSQLVTAALADALRRLARSADSRSPELLWARVGEALEASRAAYRALNNARINLRACRQTIHDDSALLPAELVHYRHHGNYRGAFCSMAELGNCLRGALGITAGLSPAERAAIACDLHLRGEIWTIEQEEGAVHVFGRPGTAADLFLASERPAPDT